MAALVKRSVSLAGHRTSLALEPAFWRVLETMAAARGLSLAALVAKIDGGRGAQPLASACRLAALAHALDSKDPGRDEQTRQ
jgi:predicted DNA-binding ribbon-helix-helix protein